MTKDLNIKPATIKLNENIEIMFFFFQLILAIFFEHVSSGKDNRSKNKQMIYKRKRIFYSKRNLKNSPPSG